MNHLYPLFKMEVMVDIKLYRGELDTLKLNHWLQQIKVYINVHHIEEEENIFFLR